MNGFIEGGAYGNGANGSTWYPVFKAYIKMTDVVKPSPANLLVFLDEHPDSINDGWFITNPYSSTEFEDLPANYHNRGCGLSYADGHAEIHKWLWAQTVQAVKYENLNGSWPASAGANPDIAFVLQHSTVQR